jgi:hypothetical protein
MDGASGSPTPRVGAEVLDWIVHFLRTLSPTWLWRPLDYQRMPATAHAALVLLTEAGVIEWTVCGRLFRHGYHVEFEFELHGTGSRCFVVAVSEICKLASQADRYWPAATIFPQPFVGWWLPLHARLTWLGERLRAGLNQGDTNGVLNHVVAAALDAPVAAHWSVHRFERLRVGPGPWDPSMGELDEDDPREESPPVWFPNDKEVITPASDANMLAGGPPGVRSLLAPLVPAPEAPPQQKELPEQDVPPQQEALPQQQAPTEQEAATVPAAQPGSDAGDPGESMTAKPLGGFLSGKELAEAFGIPKSRREAFLKTLHRARLKLGDGCWMEPPDRRQNAPRFLYKADSPTVQALVAKYKTLND